MKISIFKRAMSLILSIAMISGLWVATASAANPLLGDANTALIGEVEEIDYSQIKNGNKIKVHYKVYADHTKVKYISTYAAGLEAGVYLNGVAVFEKLGANDIYEGVDSPMAAYVASKGETLGFDDGNGDYHVNYIDEENDYYGDFVVEYTIKNANYLITNLQANGDVLELTGLMEDTASVTDALYTIGFTKDGVEYEYGPDQTIVVAPVLHAKKTAPVNFVMNEDAEGNEITFDIATTGVPTEEVRVPIGDDYPIPAITATYTDDTVDPAMKYVLKNWKVTGWTAEEIAKEGTITNMPEAGVKLTAVYDKDSNGDDIPDSEQVTVKYTIREGDVGGVSQVLVEGKNIKGTDASYVLDLNAALGAKAASVVPATGQWKLDGFYAKGTKIAATTDALAACKVPDEAGEYPIEIRMIYDADDDGVDDRLTLTVTVENTDGKAIDVATIENVKQNATYVVKNEKGEDAVSGNVGKDIENGFTINVTGKAADKKDGKYPFETWKVTTEKETVTDVDGNEVEVVKSITVEPEYSTEADTKEPIFPGPVIDGTDPENEDDEISDDPKPIEVAGDAFIVFRDEKGEVIEGYGKVDPDAITADYVYPNDKVAAKKNGNPMDAWKLTGITSVDRIDPTYGDALPADTDFDFPHYFMDPHYVVGEVTVTVNETKNDGTTNTTELTLPAEGTVEYTGADGQPVVVEITPADIATGKTIELPKNEDMPKKNDEGKYFKDAWTVEGPVDTDDPADGVGDKYTLVPVYGEPDDDDIEIVPVIPGDDPDPDDPDKPDGLKANGEGYTVLKGNYGEETEANVHFYVSVLGIPADANDLTNGILTAKAVGSYGFESLIKEQAVAVEYKGEVEAKDGSGDKYGDFVVTWKQGKSRIATITMNYKNGDADKTVNHDVITVADANKTGVVNMDDATTIRRVILGRFTATVESAATIANADDVNYYYELMDVNKTQSVNMDDITEIRKMTLGRKPIN